MELKFRIDDRNARQEFNVAMQEFQETCPPIPKGGLIDFATKGGRGMKVPYARLHEDIEPVIRQPLLAVGLSYAFSQELDGALVTAHCNVSHIGGHSRVSGFTGTSVSKSAMSEMQRIGAGTTYAKRQALIGAFSLRVSDSPDIGGNDPAGIEPVGFEDLARISESLHALYEDDDGRDRATGWICDRFEVTGLADLRKADLPAIWRIFEARKQRLRA